MDVKEIITIVSAGALAILYIVLAVIAIFKKVKSGEKINAEDITNAMAEIAKDVMPLVGAAEIAFKSVAGMKTGTLKLKDVLNDIKDKCVEKGITFDKSYWTDFIQKAVELININRDQSSETTTETAVVQTTSTTKV